MASTNIAQKWKYNSTEYEEALGLNLYEMDVRSYDPAIARWTSIDPVTHYSMSTYTAFDNNPVYWSDPSGADSYKYNWESKQYEQYDDDGKLINDNASFNDAIKWAESNNNWSDYDQKYEREENSESDQILLRGTPFVVAGKEAATKVATTTATSTAAGLSATSVGLLTVPLLFTGDESPDVREKRQARVYITYLKYGPNGEVYAGRASGYGTPQEILARRDSAHHMNTLGFGPAILDRFQKGDGTAIRGREQQLIDFYGGALSDPDRRPNANSANRIRGVSKWNLRGGTYHYFSTMSFGELYKYTGHF